MSISSDIRCKVEFIFRQDHSKYNRVVVLVTAFVVALSIEMVKYSFILQWYSCQYTALKYILQHITLPHLTENSRYGRTVDIIRCSSAGSQAKHCHCRLLWALYDGLLRHWSHNNLLIDVTREDCPKSRGVGGQEVFVLLSRNRLKERTRGCIGDVKGEL
jgi:hypothetical protein